MASRHKKGMSMPITAGYCIWCKTNFGFTVLPILNPFEVGCNMFCSGIIRTLNNESGCLDETILYWTEVVC